MKFLAVFILFSTCFKVYSNDNDSLVVRINSIGVAPKVKHPVVLKGEAYTAAQSKDLYIEVKYCRVLSSKKNCKNIGKSHSFEISSFEKISNTLVPFEDNLINISGEEINRAAADLSVTKTSGEIIFSLKDALWYWSDSEIASKSYRLNSGLSIIDLHKQNEAFAQIEIIQN